MAVETVETCGEVAAPATVVADGSEPEAPGSVVVAQGLGARTRRGWVFQGVNLAVAPGELVTVVGAAGSGRTSLLLALAGHFRTTEGTVEREGRATLGYVSGVHEPEPGLTVAEHVEERLVLLGQASWSLRRRRRKALGLLEDVALDPNTLGRNLDVLGSHLLCLTLARVNRPALIVVDNVDSGLSIVEQDTLRTALLGTGSAVVVAARDAWAGRTYNLEHAS